jgi:hypothetical protein
MVRIVIFIVISSLHERIAVMQKVGVAKTFLLSAVVLCSALIPVSAGAQKASVFKYHSHQPYDEVYVDTLEAVSAAKFIVREENREQGTINAQLMSWGGMGEYAAAFIIVGKDKGGVFIRAMFTRRTGDIGTGAKSWNKHFERSLKKQLPDLTEDSPN